MNKAVIFDIDGVLIDSYDAHFKSWQMAGRQHNIDITVERFEQSFGRTSRDIIRQWWPDGITDEQITQIDDEKEAAFREVIEVDFPVMEGAIELIESLHATGFALAVGSSGPPENVDLVMRKLDRESMFGARVTGSDVTRGKPDPQVFQIAASKLKVAVNRCAVIEDAPAGIAAANAAEMTSIALTGTATEPELGNAELIVDSLYKLSPELIDQLLDKENLDG